MKREISWGAVAVTLAAVIGISSQLGGKAGHCPGRFSHRWRQRSLNSSDHKESLRPRAVRRN
jgi:hypothetical protein